MPDLLCGRSVRSEEARAPGPGRPRQAAGADPARAALRRQTGRFRRSFSTPARRRLGPWRRPPLWIVGAIAAIAAVGWIDRRVSEGVDLSLLYAAALAGAGWWLGRRYAALAAVLATALWFSAELARRPAAEARFAVWGAITRLALFGFVGAAMGILRSNRRRLRRSRRSLEEEIERARIDPETELLNARGFLERLDRELGQSLRPGLTWAIAAIEVDGLRRYRDEHAAPAEEALVRRIGAVIRRAIRASDTAARLGHQEFAVAFRDVEREVVENTLRRAISGIAGLASDDPEARVSAAIGVAFFPAPPEDPKEALRQAEKALHAARETGAGALFVREEGARALPLTASPAG